MTAPLTSRPPMTEAEDAEANYYAALSACLDRYRPMAEHAERRDIVEFIDQIHDEIGYKAPLNKLNRWIGYIQGVLIEIGCTGVMAERNWSRPLFRPLDFPAAIRAISDDPDAGGE